MAVGKSKSHRNPPSSSTKSDKSETFVDVTEYQRLDDRQLDALLSQKKIQIGKDADSTSKIRAGFFLTDLDSCEVAGSITLVVPTTFMFHPVRSGNLVLRMEMLLKDRFGLQKRTNDSLHF